VRYGHNALASWNCQPSKSYEITYILLHFACGVAEVKCVVVMAICVSVCPSLHSHTTARTRM